jgi:hypothetical protein
MFHDIIQENHPLSRPQSAVQAGNLLGQALHLLLMFQVHEQVSVALLLQEETVAIQRFTG